MGLFHSIPLYLPPKKEEILSSWLVRNAISHDEKVLTFSRSLFNSIGIWNADIDRYTNSSVISTIVNRTPLEHRQVLMMTLGSYEGILFRNSMNNQFQPFLTPASLYHRKRSKAAIVFCPGCLKTQRTPYFQKKWRLSFQFSCDLCNHVLSAFCTKCSAPVAYHRVDIGTKFAASTILTCYNCKGSIAAVKSRKSNFVEMEAQLFFNRVLSNGWSKELNINSESFFHGVRRIASAFVRQNTWNKTYSHFPESINRKIASQLKPVSHLAFELQDFETRKAALLLTYILIQDWPTVFIDSCKEADITSSYFFQEVKSRDKWLTTVVDKNLKYVR